jgi:hypothetical protein
MKIFILGAARSGTTALSLGFMEQGYFPIGEPYNYNMEEREDYPYPLTNLDEHENVLCKSLGYQVAKERHKKVTPTEFQIELSQYFDKVILQERKEWDSHWESYVNLFRQLALKQKYNKENNLPIHTFHKKFSVHNAWSPRELKKEHYQYCIDRGLDKTLREEKNIIREVSEKLNIEISWYEDLYGKDRNKSLEIIKSWNIPGLDNEKLNEYLHPRKKLRKEIGNKNLI